MTFDLSLKLAGILFGFIIIGTILCLPLYKWDFKKLTHSSLFTKIMWWIPIFIVLLAVLYGQAWVAIPLTLLLIAASVREFFKNNGTQSKIASTYVLLFIIWISHLGVWFFGIPAPYAIPYFAAVAVISVLSDVCAFFLGNYMGKYHLPKWLNERKHWEGVAGQVIGALVGGVIVVLVLGIPITTTIALVVGVSSAIGDLLNSAAKRSLNIKDWGKSIPGHGGFLDRLSSLSFAIATSYWFFILTF